MQNFKKLSKGYIQQQHDFPPPFLLSGVASTDGGERSSEGRGDGACVYHGLQSKGCS